MISLVVSHELIGIITTPTSPAVAPSVAEPKSFGENVKGSLSTCSARVVELTKLRVRRDPARTLQICHGRVNRASTVVSLKGDRFRDQHPASPYHAV